MSIELRATDRCDRCGAQATTVGMYDLLFCNHHAREHGLIDALPRTPTVASSG